MQTPSERRTDRLVVVPDADRVIRIPPAPTRRSTVVAMMAVLIAAAIVATAFTTYAIERGQVSDAQKASDAAQKAASLARSNAEIAAASLQAKIQAITNRLKGQLTALRSGVDQAHRTAVLSASVQREAQRTAQALAQQLLAAQSRFNSVTGPALADGTYFALVDAVGA